MTDAPRRIEKAIKDQAIAVVIRKIEASAFQTLTSATPVDTGFARSRWTPTIGAPVSEVETRPDDRDAAKASAKTRLSQNKARADQIAATYRIEQGPVFIANPARHIVPLNSGTSSQAPENFVDRAIETAIGSIGGLG